MRRPINYFKEIGLDSNVLNVSSSKFHSLHCIYTLCLKKRPPFYFSNNSLKR